jgi:hypothetical protein
MITDDMSYVRDVDALVAASRLMELCGEFSKANPSTTLDKNPYVKPCDDLTRKAIGSKNVLWICDGCNFVNVPLRRVDDLPRTTCCDASIRLDMHKPKKKP